MAIVPSPDADRRPAAGTLEFAAGSFAGDSPEPASRFPVGTRIHWRARFARPAASVRLDLVTVRCHASGWEEVVSGHTMWLSHPDVPGYAGWIGPGGYDGAGRYTLRLVSGATVLAEGVFEILDSTTGQVH